MSELYKEEILELTELLRDDEEWTDIREILIKKGFDLHKIVLVSFMEDEVENEYGVIITNDMIIYEYERSTQRGKNPMDSFKIKDITDDKNERDNYPQISVAINMIKNKELF